MIHDDGKLVQAYENISDRRSKQALLHHLKGFSCRRAVLVPLSLASGQQWHAAQEVKQHHLKLRIRSYSTH